MASLLGDNAGRIALRIALLVVLAAGGYHTVEAQERDTTTAKDRESVIPGKTWLIVSLGRGLPQYGSAGVSLSSGKTLQLQISASQNTEPGGLFGDPPHVNSLSGAVGVGTRGDKMQASVFVGPAFVWGVAPPEIRDGQPFSAGGVVFNAQYFWVPITTSTSRIGIGLDLYGNLNPAWSGVGARIGLFLGSLK